MFDHQSLLTSYDAIVIGSGISGLTTSLIFAKEGGKVALFERDRDLAPLIRPYRRKGCGCSPGLHILGWLGKGEVISSLCDYLNVLDGIEVEPNENGFGDIIVGGKTHHIPRGFERVEESLLSYFPECPEAVVNYLRSVKEINERTFHPNHSLDPKTRKNGFGGADYCSLEDFLKRNNASQGLIDLLGTFNHFLMGSKADEVPFHAHAFVLGGYYQSPGVINTDGIGRLLSNFRRELDQHGVDLFLATEVSEVLVGNDRNVLGVKTKDGRSYFSPTVIASYHPQLLLDSVNPGALRPIYQRRLAEAENTFGFYVAFYKIIGDQDIDAENFIYYHDHLGVSLGATFNRSGGYRVISIFLAEDCAQIPVGAGRTLWAEARRALMEDTIYERIPELRGKIDLLDYLKPWSFERYTKTINGSAYGVKHTVCSMGIQQRVPLRGLYLVGQAIYPGFMGSMISGFGLAVELLKADQLWARVINQ